MPEVQNSVLGPTKTKRPTEAEIAAYRREILKKVVMSSESGQDFAGGCDDAVTDFG